MHVSPYIYFNGNCEEALNFYAKVTGAKVGVMLPVAGSPAEAHMPETWKTKILYAHLDVGDTQLLASDAPPGHYEKGQGYCVNFRCDTPADAERIFAALSEGGAVRMKLEETFFAARFGMLTDRYGISWMVMANTGT